MERNVTVAKAKAPKIEYTPAMQEAMGEMAECINRLERLVHDAGCKSLKLKVVWGKGGSFELEARREWNPNPPPYAEFVPKPPAPLLARSNV
jgi:hypothetical protein